ncbi:DUF4124 domain-containing protein [Dasania marina]|uniref:DUF4124 domain-containing protein n=1 Tax=Dasania marina TaxID=471499 RepID=UPI0012EA152B|nr:DUF4124 domain-containing protein [Dasania marina]
MHKICLWLFVVSSPAFSAEFYQCKDAKDRPIFSQTPCEVGAKKQYVNETGLKGEAELKRLADSKRMDEIKRKLIPEQYRNIMALREQRNNALSSDIASAEQAAISQRYEQRIDEARITVKQLEQELSMLSD